MYNQATSLANQGQWQNAVNDLNTASNDLSQAAAAEQTYQNSLTPTPTNNNNSTPEFPSIAVLAIFLVLSLFAVIMLTVRKRKITKT